MVLEEKTGTELALMNFTRAIYEEINNDQKEIAVFLDVKKAFDAIDHKLMLEKLYRAGFRR